MKQTEDLRNGVWVTPKEFFEPLRQEFDLEVDAAASSDNAMLPTFWDENSDGLKQDWTGLKIWLNPPYGRKIINWIKKASESNASVIVALLPARTDTRWFHDYIYKKTEIRFIRGRVYFSGTSGSDRPMFPSMVVIFKKP